MLPDEIAEDRQARPIGARRRAEAAAARVLPRRRCTSRRASCSPRSTPSWPTSRKRARSSRRRFRPRWSRRRPRSRARRYLLDRGEYDRPKDEVPRVTPAFLPALPEGQPRDRLGFARWLVSPRASADRPRRGQPLLAAALRHGPGQDGRGLRRPGRAAQPPRAARLAGRRVPRERLGREGPHEADRHVGHLPAVRPRRPPRSWRRIPRTACSPAARASGSTPRSLRDQALAVSGLLVEHDRRPEREAAAARRACGRRSATPAATRPSSRPTRARKGPPPQPLHLLEADRAAAADDDLRRPVARVVHRAARADQHAAAGAAADERAAVRRGARGPGRAGDDAKAARQPEDRPELPVPHGRPPARPTSRGADRADARPSTTSWPTTRPSPRRPRQLIAVGETQPDADPRLRPSSPPGPWSRNLVLNLDEVVNKKLSQRQPGSRSMDPFRDRLELLTRRHFFGRTGAGLGAAALASLLPAAPAPAQAAATGGLPGLPHFAPKAKRVIYLFMAGGPSQIDLFDYKPKMGELVRQGPARVDPQGPAAHHHDLRPEAVPDRPVDVQVRAARPVAARGSASCCRTRRRWSTTSPSSRPSAPRRSTTTRPSPTSAPGNQLPGRPSLGAWLSYGLGTENENLPAFVVLTATWTGRKDAQAIYNRLWGARLPAQRSTRASRCARRATRCSTCPIPPGVDRQTRRRMLDGLAPAQPAGSTRRSAIRRPRPASRSTRWPSACRRSVPELTDIVRASRSTSSTCTAPTSRSRAPSPTAACWPGGWPSATCASCRSSTAAGTSTATCRATCPSQCRDVDQAGCALIQDLKQRGLLDDTLVVWGGEFGRTVYCQGGLTADNYGRDHHPRCFTIWMAGGGIKPGVVYGETDEFSYNIVENPVHIHDLNATILHCLGIDHRRLTVQVPGPRHAAHRRRGPCAGEGHPGLSPAFPVQHTEPPARPVGGEQRRTALAALACRHCVAPVQECPRMRSSLTAAGISACSSPRALHAQTNPAELNYDEAKVPAYTLPDPLVARTARRSTARPPGSRSAGLSCSRSSRTRSTGAIPPRPDGFHYQVFEEDTQALGGLATRRQIRLLFDGTDEGPALTCSSTSPTRPPQARPRLPRPQLRRQPHDHRRPRHPHQHKLDAPNAEKGVVDNQATEKNPAAPPPPAGRSR